MIRPQVVILGLPRGSAILCEGLTPLPDIEKTALRWRIAHTLFHHNCNSVDLTDVKLWHYCPKAKIPTVVYKNMQQNNKPFCNVANAQQSMHKNRKALRECIYPPNVLTAFI